MNQIQVYPAAGDVVNDRPTTTIDKTGAAHHVSSENESASAVASGNAVLERDAQTKGRWFAYLKTKQFWITLLLGQGKHSLSLMSLVIAITISTSEFHRYITFTNNKCDSPRDLYYFD
jgi:hypothetical protein